MQHRTRVIGALFVFHALVASCGFRHPAVFQVVPDAQNYLLRSPDRRETQFPNILRDYNGFEPGKSWVDLRPLMELRIENAYYKQGSSRRGLDGFLGTEVARYAVRKDGLRLVSVQEMNGRPSGDRPVQELISDAAAHARRYRLFFEIVFNRSTNSHGSVLLGANSTEQLERLSAELKRPEEICGDVRADCTAFPEACSVSIEMKIVVNGKTDSVDWGSLLPSVVGEHPRHLQMRRLYAGRLVPVEINFSDRNALRLPLLPGDHIAWD